MRILNMENEVVPHAGTWIEISHKDAVLEFHIVVPHAGTWIEIFSDFRN